MGKRFGVAARRACVLLSIAGTTLIGTSWAAGDPDTGRAKAGVCAGCHGTEGISSNDLWPNLAGQKQGYLVVQIRAFRDGERQSDMMKPMVVNLSDQDIDDLAAFYSGLK